MERQTDVPRARNGIGDLLANYLERPTGGQVGDVGRAASATRAFLFFSLLLAGAYAVFFAAFDAANLAPIVISGTLSVLLFAVGLGFVSRGRQLTAAVIAVVVGTAQVAFVTSFIGWIAGFQLFLFAGGQLVFMIFTDKQRLLRTGYVIIAIGAFFYCQLLVPEHGWGSSLPDSVSGVMFSTNASATMLLVFALAAASHASAARARTEASAAAARAEFLANTDELTGLSNRRPVLRRLDELSSTDPYIVAIADLDHFKRLNDTFGHECGDRVLAVTGMRLRDGLRTGDSVGRWGGEEFIFVMGQSTLAEAADIMERVRAHVAEPIPCTGHSHEVTMSVGVSDAHPDGMASRALQRADAALYQAKSAGRNRVELVEGPPQTLATDVQRRRRS